MLIVAQLAFKLGGRSLVKGIVTKGYEGALLKWRIFDFVYQGGFADYKSPLDSISRKTAQTDAAIARKLGIQVSYFTSRDLVTGNELQAESIRIAKEFGIEVIKIGAEEIWHREAKGRRSNAEFVLNELFSPREGAFGRQLNVVVEPNQLPMANVTKSDQLDQKTLDSCAVVHQTWNQITRTWTLPTIHMLGQMEPARFNQLKNHIKGISATSLAERLSQLEKFGVVQRKVYAEEKPRIEYSLTVKGHEVYKILCDLAGWSKRWEGKEPNSREFLVPK